MNRHERMSRGYTTFDGAKLVANADRLAAIRSRHDWRPITVQLAPTEACEDQCPWCSVANRPIRSSMPWSVLEQCVADFAALGARSLEITGGGNPLLYRSDGRTVNDVVALAHRLGLQVGIITNARSLRVLTAASREILAWVRVSLIGLDEPDPTPYDFGTGLEGKLGVSYIINTGDDSNPLDRRGRYHLTTVHTIDRIVALLEANPHVRFCRIAGNCLRKGNNARARADWLDVVDRHPRMFVKDIGDDDDPHPTFCGIGALRPYVASLPTGGGYAVYTCTSHVLAARNYSLEHKLCDVADIIPTWQAMRGKQEPYTVGSNRWDETPTCARCYYARSNAILEAASCGVQDAEFA